MWGFPAGLIGGRIYFLITTPSQIPPHWWGPFAIWKGGLGIWGGIACGVAAGLWVLYRRLDPYDVRRFMDAAVPGLLVAQAFGRVGNYFNQELFGGPTTLPWGLKIDLAHRPPHYTQYMTFHPTFLYEIVWNLLLAAFLVWLGHHRRIRPPGLFALYVAGYSGFQSVRGDVARRLLQPHLRVASELLRSVDPVHPRVAVVRGDPARVEDALVVPATLAPTPATGEAAGRQAPASAARSARAQVTDGP